MEGVTTSNRTKGEAINALVLAFENGTIQILNDDVLINKIMAYEQERLSSGVLRYGAPAGMHDDCVMSLALAWRGATTYPMWWIQFERLLTPTSFPRDFPLKRDSRGDRVGAYLLNQSGLYVDGFAFSARAKEV